MLIIVLHVRRIGVPCRDTAPEQQDDNSNNVHVQGDKKSSGIARVQGAKNHDSSNTVHVQGQKTPRGQIPQHLNNIFVSQPA